MRRSSLLLALLLVGCSGMVIRDCRSEVEDVDCDPDCLVLYDADGGVYCVCGEEVDEFPHIPDTDVEFEL